MTDIIIRKQGHAGLITLNRPKALNALTWEMCLTIEAAFNDWRDDPDVDLILIDGAGDRAFCSGGDIADMYQSGQVGDFDYGRKFWRDEYRLNAKIATYPKPVVAFLHGFTMGGGVGVGCHASHRIVCENSQIAMPECGIGLVPDVGGTALLGQAPGRTGFYLGLTGDRMDAGDAIYAGFADYYVPMADWPSLKDQMINSGTPALPQHPAPAARLADWQADIDRLFDASSAASILAQLDDTDVGRAATKAMTRNSPLAMACAVPLINMGADDPDITRALHNEYRFTHRAVEHSDFIEGIRAAIIDRDRTPTWKHATLMAVSEADITGMIAPLGDLELTL